MIHPVTTGQEKYEMWTKGWCSFVSVILPQETYYISELSNKKTKLKTN